jgi:hypothetical protein
LKKSKIAATLASASVLAATIAAFTFNRFALVGAGQQAPSSPLSWQTPAWFIDPVGGNDNTGY